MSYSTNLQDLGETRPRTEFQAYCTITEVDGTYHVDTGWPSREQYLLA